jgi:hypothetical protein
MVNERIWGYKRMGYYISRKVFGIIYSQITNSFE